jgi:protein involved in polysaccharide export with SLBB domain
MLEPTRNSSLVRHGCLLAAIVCLACAGCANSVANAIPVRRLPPHLKTPPRNQKEPIDFSLLRQKPATPRLIVPGDVLGIHVDDVLGKEGELPPVFFPSVMNGPDSTYVEQPAVGTPITVQDTGTISLPLVPPIKVAGLSLADAQEVIRKTYVEGRILQPQRDRVVVTLMRPKLHQVLVLREDTGGQVPTIRPKDAVIMSRRGTAFVFDLPAYENDVLHALSLSGGLPGQDAHAEVWVLRGTGDMPLQAVANQFDKGVDPLQMQRPVVRIPLRLDPGEPPPFSESDIILNDRDVIFIASRDREYFIGAGLLPGGYFPIPRDQDLDVMGAIAIASGSVAGPAGFNAAAFAFRGGSGPGNVVPPSRAIVIRTMPGGGQLKIHCDLNKAMNNPNERLKIQSGDILVLQYTPGELAWSIALNLINWGFAIPNGPQH